MMSLSMMQPSFWRPSSPDWNLDTLFNRVFSEWESELTPSLRSGLNQWPQAESYVDDNAFIVKMDLPGMNPEDINVSLERNVLTISGERRSMREHQDDYHHKEVHYGSFQRSFRLPEGVNPEEVRARYVNGVLEVSVPVPAHAAPHKVAIESHAAQKQLEN